MMDQQNNHGLKPRAIKKVVRSKLSAWLDTIEDEVVRKMASADAIVTGGCIASMLLGEPVNDYDIYFKTRETTKAVAQYYVDRFEIKNKSGIICPIHVDSSRDDRICIKVQSAGIASHEGAAENYEYFEAENYEYFEGADPGGESAEAYVESIVDYAEPSDQAGYAPVFMSANAITLSGRIQIITRFYGDADAVHRNFDFVHCMNHYCHNAGAAELSLRKDALECLLSRELRYVGSLYPVCSIIRSRKFVKRGWSINAGQFLKMAFQVSELDLSDLEVLEDQLTGVDAAYFQEVIETLREKHANGKSIDRTYLATVIDRIF